MVLDKQVQSFLRISEAFLKHTGDSLSVNDGPKADDTPVTVYAHGEALCECVDALR